MENTLLNIPLNEIAKDYRSLTRIVNIILQEKFISRNLSFSFHIPENSDYIKIEHKKRYKEIKLDWAVYLTEDKQNGLHVQFLRYRNYVFLKNKEQVGNFIKSKNWVNYDKQWVIIRDLRNDIERLTKKKEYFETFCT